MHPTCGFPAGLSQATLPSWDTPAASCQPPHSHPVGPQAHRTSSAEPSWQASKPATGLSWNKQSESSPMASSVGPSDPFAGLPAPQAAVPTYQGGANDLMSDSLFSSLSTGELLLLCRNIITSLLLHSRPGTPCHFHVQAMAACTQHFAFVASKRVP